MSNPLDEVLDWYTTAYDSLRVTRRVITLPAPKVVTDKHVFFNLPSADCESKIEGAIRELENMVVFVMVAVFERLLREFVVAAMAEAISRTDVVREAICDRLASNIEYWKFGEELIDVFVMVSSAERGNVKQLVRYRDWIAHGHFVKLPPPVTADVRTTYDRLTAFLKNAGVIS